MKKPFNRSLPWLNLFLVFFPALSFSQELLLTGSQKEFYAGSATALDGSNYNAGASTYDTPPFNVIVHDTDSDGNVIAHIRITKTGGRFKANETLSNATNHGVVPDGSSFSKVSSKALVKIQKSSFSFFADLTVDDYDSAEEFTQSLTVTVELLSSSGSTVLDSVTLPILVSGDMALNTSSSSISTAWDETPVVNLYEDGVLPGSGRPPFVSDPSEPVYNSNVDGSIQNDSDVEQSVSLWAADENGDMQLVGKTTVLPGANVPVEMGVDLDPGVTALLTSSGEVTGVGSSTLNSGDLQTLNLVFPPQALNDVVITYENDTLSDQQTTVGSDQIPQEIVVVPPGISEIERTYSGSVNIQGGTTQFTDVQNETTHMVVSVPSGGPAATVVGTSTVANSSGGTSTVSIIQYPSGTQVSAGGASPTSPISPPSPPNGVTGELNAPTSSVINLNIDEVVAAINAIKAEYAAASAASPDSSEEIASSPSGDALVDIDGKLNEVKTGIDTLTDTGPEGEFLGVAPTFSNVDAGSISSYSFPMLGETFVIDFSHPAVPWFRNLLLVVIGLMWFFFLVKISNK